MNPDFSIRKQLLISLSATLLVIWVAVISISYKTTGHEVEEVYDASLAKFAKVLTVLISHEAEEKAELQEQLGKISGELGLETIREKSPLLMKLLREYGQQDDNQEDYLSFSRYNSGNAHPYEAKLAFLILAKDGSTLLRSSKDVPMTRFQEGFQIIRKNNEKWRTYGITDPEIKIRTMVAEQLQVRTEIQKDILMGGLWPTFLALPVILLMVWSIVSQGFKPIQILANRISKQSPSSLEPISEVDIPNEVVPMIHSINFLFKRLTQTFENERNFTANAAHELRTPLAALKANIQILEMRSTPDTRDILDEIKTGIDSTSHLLDQLLTLARAEARSRNLAELTDIDLIVTTQSVISDVIQMAFQKDITLALDAPDLPIQVKGDEVLLATLIRNLLTNAIRYTPEGGEVSVQVNHEARITRIIVEDSGPGIPEEQQGKMFQRFQRGEVENIQGAGLGLSIVKQIAFLHQIELSLSNRKDQSGLRVELVFP